MNATLESLQWLRERVRLLPDIAKAYEVLEVIDEEIANQTTWAAIDGMSPEPANADPAVWQPIETAPRDGTWIMVAADSGYIGVSYRVAICRYVDGYSSRGCWRDAGNDSFTDSGSEARWWMPLIPAPPVCVEPVDL